jgi:nitroreductase
MSVIETVRSLLAVRSFRADPISSDAVRDIVEAGHLTASAMNRQPWHFIVVDDPATLREMGRLAKTGPYIAGAQLAIAVAIEREAAWAESDASRAIQSMMLVAWDQGIASNWVGFRGLDEVGALLGVPETHELLAVVPLGYPVEEIGKGQKRRKPIGEVVSRGRFGVPYPEKTS